jgi:5-formyltetrahydrofolate cyclo-ligase
MIGNALDMKRKVRQQVRERLKAISPAARADASLAAAQLLIQQEHWKNAETVLLYISLGDELDLLSCVEMARKQGKTVALPRYLPGQGSYCAALLEGSVADLVLGPFGIPEPRAESPALPCNRLDLVLAPGVAFDLAGRRLGRGKGFYDRLLAEVSGAKCGVALDEQIVPDLPHEPHDIAVDFVLTPSRWVAVRPAKT